MGRSDFLYSGFLSHLKYAPTSCQDALLRKVADFVSTDEDDILVVNGYAGTGKTTAISAVIAVLKEYQTKCVLLAPTGRAAKVLSSYAGQPAFTVHKHIYRQKSVGGDGFGQFSLAPNKDKETLFVVDEVSLIGIDAGQQQSTASFGSGNLLEDLISFVRSGVECKVILIGDAAQLPPVGLDASPALLKDYMAMMGGGAMGMPMMGGPAPQMPQSDAISGLQKKEHGIVSNAREKAANVAQPSEGKVIGDKG